MMTTRGTFATAALAGLLSLGLSGCGDSTDTAGGTGPATTTTTTAAADPKTALASSTKAMKEGNYAFGVDGPGAVVTGLVHLPSKSAKLAIDASAESFTMKLEFVITNPNRWVRMSSNGKSMLSKGAPGDTWFHVDTTKLKKGSDLDLDLSKPDVIDVGALLAAASDAKGDSKTITGTIDGTKVKSPDGFLDNDTLEGMGAGAAKLPYTAKLDDKGRLTELVIDAPASEASQTPAGKWTFTVTGYGEQAALTKPTGKVKELPSGSYAMLNA
ncbi:hypothetical protein GCM10010172_24440 [Paractinoplanes ferrugineus]|uniref:Lipoprotein n=1 Tax=Paractinoplanes ferrugineus TaxID=113564 RepID=A0A919IUA9_9ACTN|nr:hypothetical protein [Actinoplanes ferrugineus]GIE08645.1 hypothetical protein Afe05nite_04850 [Actinoplanes ferrugineus]